jgi:hypothetical protein
MCRGRFEDLVLRRGFSELELELLVLLGDGRGVLFEAGELGFEVFDVAFFAFAKGALSRGGVSKALLGRGRGGWKSCGVGVTGAHTLRDSGICGGIAPVSYRRRRYCFLVYWHRR